MKKLEITKNEYEKIKRLMKKNKDKNIDRRLKTIALRYEGFLNKEISKITGFSTTWVTLLVKEFKEKGLEEFVKNKYKGNNRNLSVEKEAEILKDFEKKAEKGQVVTIKEIKQVFDEEVGKDTGRGYIYMVLDRHGWRKVMPRSKHPKKACEEEIKSSKKLNPK